MTGTLKLVEYESTQGKTPRNFAIDPTGSFVLAENMGSGTIVVFKIVADAGHSSRPVKPFLSRRHVASSLCQFPDEFSRGNHSQVRRLILGTVGGSRQRVEICPIGRYQAIQPKPFRRRLKIGEGEALAVDPGIGPVHEHRRFHDRDAARPAIDAKTRDQRRSVRLDRLVVHHRGGAGGLVGVVDHGPVRSQDGVLNALYGLLARNAFLRA